MKIGEMDKSYQKGDRGFTLIELMMVVIILGVLAVIAYPVYTGYLEVARTTEGVARLGSIMTASKTYYQRFSNWPSAPGDAGYYADYSNSRHFSYAILSGGGGTGSFAVRATGLAVDDMSGVLITMTCADLSSEGVLDVTGI